MSKLKQLLGKQKKHEDEAIPAQLSRGGMQAEKECKVSKALEQLAGQEDDKRGFLDGDSVSPAIEDKPKKRGGRDAKHQYAFKLFDANNVARSISGSSRASKKLKQEEVLDKMAKHTGYVQSRALPKKHSEIMDEMDATFPHFKHVTECLRQRMQLKACHAYPVLHFGINILLDGPAGVGKSAYLIELSQKLGTLFHSISCASASNGMDLTGLSEKWSNGKYGKIHDLLFNHECPNPIILLDEVEKSGESNHPFANVLYGLLEKNNAKIFKDEYVQVCMDASAINWFATCNYLDRLDAPIRDRFEVFTVDAPNADDLRKIVPNLYGNIVRSHELESVFTVCLNKDVIDRLALAEGISIRKIGSALETALANAVKRSGYDPASRRKIKLEVADLPVVSPDQGSVRQPIGFVWS